MSFDCFVVIVLLLPFQSLVYMHLMRHPFQPRMVCSFGILNIFVLLLLMCG